MPLPIMERGNDIYWLAATGRTSAVTRRTVTRRFSALPCAVSFVATGLASLTPAAEPRPETRSIRRLLHGVNIRPWAVLALLTVVSIMLLPFFEVEANRQDGTYYGDWIFGAFATALRSSSWVPALVALGFATGFMHYLLDRNVYRLSNPEVRAAARGLLARPEQKDKRD